MSGSADCMCAGVPSATLAACEQERAAPARIVTALGGEGDGERDIVLRVRNTDCAPSVALGWCVGASTCNSSTSSFRTTCRIQQLGMQHARLA